MREHIQSLSQKQAMLLLTLVMLEGEEDLQLLRYLPQEEAQSLQSAGRAVCAEPRKQALPQVVREIKMLLKSAQRSPFEQFDPEWMAEFLAAESPRVISALLQQFPRSTSERALLALPGQIRQKLPQHQREPHPEIARWIRYLFDAKCPSRQFAAQQAPPEALSIEGLCKLQGEELMLLIRELGLRELAIAFRAAGRGPLTELCRLLEPNDAERLLEVIRSLNSSPNSPEAKEEIKSAQRVIQAISKRNRSKSQLIEDAGLAKLREASFELTAEEQNTMALALPRRIGKHFLEHPGLDLRPQEKYRVQCEALQTIQQLSQIGKLPPQWGQLQLVLPPAPPADLQ